MPTYPYSCEACQHEFDAFQKISDSALTKCPSCGKESLKRGIGGGMASFNFKGDGFYVNDYKKGKDSPPNSCCPCGKKEGGGGCS